MYVFSPDVTSTDLPSSNLIFSPVSSQIFSPCVLCVACVSRSGTALDSIDGPGQHQSHLSEIWIR